MFSFIEGVVNQDKEDVYVLKLDSISGLSVTSAYDFLSSSTARDEVGWIELLKGYLVVRRAVCLQKWCVFSIVVVA